MEMSRNQQIIVLVSFLTLMSSSLPSLSRPLPDTAPNGIHGVEHGFMKVGVILDMGSWSGKSIDICISLAISDFYALNSAYATRIVPYPIDSKGEASRALSAVHHLLNNVKVQAIIVPESSLEGKLMALLAEKAKVPFFTFTDSPSSKEYHPYLLPIKPDVTTTFKAAASLVESFKWTNAIVVYDDTEYGRETLPCLVKQFHKKNIVITYSSAISPLDGHDQISKVLHKVLAMGTTIIIVHMSTSQASSLLSYAKKLRMVNEKYTWIITDKAMDLLPLVDNDAIASIEGVFLLKPYIPASLELLNFTRSWRKEYDSRYPSSVAREMNLSSLWAYDAVWALAESYERVRNRTSIDLKQGSELTKDGVSLTSTILAYEISHIKFKGLTGDFELKNGRVVSKVVEIVEVRSGSKEKSVGSWSLADGIRKEINPSNSSGQYSIDKRLKIAVPVTKSTFKEFINAEFDPTTMNGNYNGFCIDLFKAVMPPEVPYKFVPFVGADGEFSGSYDELLSMISQQVYDGTVADVTILANRSQWVDFTVPYTYMGVGMITQISDKKDKWIFFRPLALVVWLTVAASFILLGFIIWLFEHSSNKKFQGSTTAQQVGMMLWFSSMTLYFAQREKLSSPWSRFVVIVWSFIVLILTSSYTAILSSLLTVQQIQLASKGNIIGYHTGSFVQGVIVNNMNYSDYRLQPYQSAKDFADALSRGSKNGGVTAIIDEIPYLKVVLDQYPHDYTMISSDSSTSGFGFAFRKGSPLVHDVSREISRLREDGRLLMLEKKWFGGESSLVSPESKDKPKILDFGDLGGLVYIGAAVFGLALFRYMYTFFQERLHLNAYIVKIIAGGRLATLMNYLDHTNPNSAVE